MKKLSFQKRILSFVLIFALLASLFCGNLVANAATETDTKTVSFSVLDGDTAGTLSNDYWKNPLGTAIGYAFNGYSYFPNDATDSMVWNYQNISEFCIYGLGNTSYNDDTYNSFYKFCFKRFKRLFSATCFFISQIFSTSSSEIGFTILIGNTIWESPI